MSPGSWIFSFVFLFILSHKVFLAMFVADKGVLPSVKDSVGFQFYVDIENENRDSACRIRSQPKKCCLIDLNNEDCDVFEMYGVTEEYIEPKDRTTLIFILPVLQQYDLVGYCDVLVNYYCKKKREKLHFKIPFDTSLEKVSNILLENYNEVQRKKCETVDLDSLNNCLPVDCEQKYLGKRSFFDVNIKKCMKTPVCIGDTEKQMPNVIYDPINNVCKDLNLPLSIQDVYAMSTGLGVVKKPIKFLDDVKVEIKSNISTISQNLYFLRDLMYGKFCPCANNPLDFSECCKKAISSIIMCIISMCAIILSIICFVNTMLWLCKSNPKAKFKECLDKMKSRCKKTEHIKCKRSVVDSEIRNALLREILVKDIPLELRESIVSICDRVDKEVRKKKRYRNMNIGSQISLLEVKDINTYSTSSSATLLDVNKDLKAK